MNESKEEVQITHAGPFQAQVELHFRYQCKHESKTRPARSPFLQLSWLVEIKETEMIGLGRSHLLSPLVRPLGQRASRTRSSLRRTLPPPPLSLLCFPVSSRPPTSSPFLPCMAFAVQTKLFPRPSHLPLCWCWTASNPGLSFFVIRRICRVFLVRMSVLSLGTPPLRRTLPSPCSAPRLLLARHTTPFFSPRVFFS